MLAISRFKEETSSFHATIKFKTHVKLGRHSILTLSYITGSTNITRIRGSEIDNRTF